MYLTYPMRLQVTQPCSKKIFIYACIKTLHFCFSRFFSGQAGVDFPVLAQIPDTGFDCGIQEFPGIYGDTGADCQVNKIRPIRIEFQ